MKHTFVLIIIWHGHTLPNFSNNTIIKASRASVKIYCIKMKIFKSKGFLGTL